MTQESDKYQESGDNSVNIQAGNLNISGLGYQEAREIALDVFKSNFIKLSREAAQIAEDRITYLVDEYLNKLVNEHEKLIYTAKDPDMQYDLFQAQSQYARSGKIYVVDLLTDILVEKAKAKHEESLLKIVLSEAIITIGKLTETQLNVLSSIFLLRYLIHDKPSSLNSLLQLIKKYLVPLFESFPVKHTSALHLQYTGCVHHDMGDDTIENILRSKYEGFFRGNLSSSEYAEVLEKIPKSAAVFHKTSEDPDQYELKMADQHDFFELCKKEGISAEQSKELYEITPLAKLDEIKNYLINHSPEFVELLEKWDQSYVGSLKLTSTGIAIAQSNLKRQFDLSYDFREWLTN